MSSVAAMMDKLAVRETIENYLHFLDARRWQDVADCFAADARSHYNFEPDALIGGDGVVGWLRARLAPYPDSDHALSHLHVEFQGEVAICESRVTASLVFERDVERRIAIRAIRYRDKLRRASDRWVIQERLHEPLWQYEVCALSTRL